VQIEAIELVRCSLPLVTPFRTAHGVESARQLLLVHVVAGGVDGWGECAALTEPGYTSEYIDGAEAVIERFLAPVVLSAGHLAAEGVRSALDGVQGHLMAKAAIEMAVLDAELRAVSQSLAARLGVSRGAVPAGVAVGITSSVEELVAQVGAYVADGYGRVKIKVAPGWVVEPVRALREAFGDLAIQVDANGSFTLDDADQLAALDEYELQLIEQPLAADDWLAHSELARRIETPICLDESIVSANAAAAALSLGACRVINVKAPRVGGLFEAVRIHDACVAGHADAWVGGMLESDIGRAANLALAALPGFTLTGDLSASKRYFADSICEPFEMVEGHIAVPNTPGIGRVPDDSQLSAFGATRRWIARPR
jgi:o-succinylbenzoate synthase